MLKVSFIKKFFGKIFNIEPHHMVLFGVALFVGGLFLFSYVSNDKTVYSVEYGDTDNSALLKRSKRKREIDAARMGENDPNARLTSRVAEGNAIALGLLQYTLYNRIVLDRQIGDVNELMRGFAESDLKPPGMTVVVSVQKISSGRVVSNRGAYFIHYQANPLVIEVLASGKSDSDGAVFVLRSPDNAALPVAKDQAVKAAYWATLYVAPEKKADASIPPPFSEPDVFRSAGWTIEPLRVSELSPEKMESIKQILSQK